MQRLNEVSWGEVAIACAAGLALGTWVFPATGLVAALAYGVLGWALVLIVISDYRAFRIPDHLSLPLILLGLVTTWWLTSELFTDRVLAAVIGGLAFYGLNVAYRRFRGFDGLGMGDVKLTAAAGAWVGLENLATVILLACIAALASVLVFRPSLAKIPDAGRTRLPFGSYESLALLATVLWQFQ